MFTYALFLRNYIAVTITCYKQGKAEISGHYQVPLRLCVGKPVGTHLLGQLIKLVDLMLSCSTPSCLQSFRDVIEISSIVQCLKSKDFFPHFEKWGDVCSSTISLKIQAQSSRQRIKNDPDMSPSSTRERKIRRFREYSLRPEFSNISVLGRMRVAEPPKTDRNINVSQISVLVWTQPQSY